MGDGAEDLTTSSQKKKKKKKKSKKRQRSPSLIIDGFIDEQPGSSRKASLIN